MLLKSSASIQPRTDLPTYGFPTHTRPHLGQKNNNEHRCECVGNPAVKKMDPLAAENSPGHVLACLAPSSHQRNKQSRCVECCKAVRALQVCWNRRNEHSNNGKTRHEHAAWSQRFIQEVPAQEHGPDGEQEVYGRRESYRQLRAYEEEASVLEKIQHTTQHRNADSPRVGVIGHDSYDGRSVFSSNP